MYRQVIKLQNQFVCKKINGFMFFKPKELSEYYLIYHEVNDEYKPDRFCIEFTICVSLTLCHYNCNVLLIVLTSTTVNSLFIEVQGTCIFFRNNRILL